MKRHTFIGWWIRMGCWKWFDGVLKQAAIEVNDANRRRIDEVIHHYIGEQAGYGRCSSDWRKARKDIQASDQMKNELIKRLRSVA